MKVFKFGGASVKDAAGVKNVARIVKQYQHENLCIVISAMGKITNALEDLVKAYVKDAANPDKFNDSKKEIFEKVKEYHYTILRDLFDNKISFDASKLKVDAFFIELANRFEKMPSANYDLVYDQIVCVGELVSTTIVSEYFNYAGITNTWFDARRLIRTDSTYREGKVDYKISELQVSKTLIPFYIGSIEKKIAITQGFIGGTSIDLTTTLGREGSDYTAAILSYLLDARDMTIWKDVPGVLNADPRIHSDAVKLDKISFHEAIELTYYGATVIHPKTIKPLQNKGIPLYVKSFLEPEQKGTVIQPSEDFDTKIASYIYKKNQVLLSIIPRDFSFVDEQNLRDLFDLFTQFNLHINLMQNSAMSFSVACDNIEEKLPQLLKKLQVNYKVKYNENCELLTVRHYTEDILAKATRGREVLVTQKSRSTARFVYKTK
jgi:aspartate kinase